MNKEKNPVGHPPLWPNVSDLEEKIQKFFDLIKNGEEEPSVVGLAYYLNTNKQTLLNYQAKDDFRELIERAKQRIEMLFTAKAYRGEVPANIFIFTAKNHYEYEDDTNLNMGNKNGEAFKVEPINILPVKPV